MEGVDLEYFFKCLDNFTGSTNDITSNDIITKKFSDSDNSNSSTSIINFSNGICEISEDKTKNQNVLNHSDDIEKKNEENIKIFVNNLMNINNMDDSSLYNASSYNITNINSLVNTNDPSFENMMRDSSNNIASEEIINYNIDRAEIKSRAEIIHRYDNEKRTIHLMGIEKTNIDFYKFTTIDPNILKVKNELVSIKISHHDTGDKLRQNAVSDIDFFQLNTNAMCKEDTTPNIDYIISYGIKDELNKNGRNNLIPNAPKNRGRPKK
jgi:hypothetical protein